MQRSAVREVVFQQTTRLGWSEICNDILIWGIDVLGLARLMPSQRLLQDAGPGGHSDGRRSFQDSCFQV